MGVPRHNGILRCLGLLANGADKVNQKLLHLFDFIAQIQANIERNLVVTAAGSMQFFANLANARGQFCLNEHMNVLGFGIDWERTALDVIENGLQAVDDGNAFLFGNDAANRQHSCVLHRARNILAVHTPVEMYGRIEVIRLFGECARGSSRPHFSHFSCFLWFILLVFPSNTLLVCLFYHKCGSPLAFPSRGRCRAFARRMRCSHRRWR